MRIAETKSVAINAEGHSEIPSIATVPISLMTTAETVTPAISTHHYTSDPVVSATDIRSYSYDFVYSQYQAEQEQHQEPASSSISRVSRYPTRSFARALYRRYYIQWKTDVIQWSKMVLISHGQSVQRFQRHCGGTLIDSRLAHQACKFISNHLVRPQERVREAGTIFRSRQLKDLEKRGKIQLDILKEECLLNLTMFALEESFY